MIVDKKRDKIERKILDSQERAFWDVHRPVPGCVNTTEADIKKSSRMKQPHKTRKSVYGLQNDVRSHSPTHTPTPEVKQPTEEELHDKIQFWQVQLDRHRLKMSKVAESLLSYTEQYMEYDPFLTPPDPSNPWISDDTTMWEMEASKEPSQQRVKRWAFGINEVLKDPVGREQFLKFLESEFSSENLRQVSGGAARSFWLAVQELKKRPIREVPTRVEGIWQEFLAPGAPSAINVDSKSYDKTTQNVKDPGRYAFEDAQEHIYKLMKSDSYSRFIRSSAYQELLQAKKKVQLLGAPRQRSRLDVDALGPLRAGRHRKSASTLSRSEESGDPPRGGDVPEHDGTREGGPQEKGAQHQSSEKVFSVQPLGSMQDSGRESPGRRHPTTKLPTVLICERSSRCRYISNPSHLPVASTTPRQSCLSCSDSFGPLLSPGESSSGAMMPAQCKARKHRVGERAWNHPIVLQLPGGASLLQLRPSWLAKA
ncbi:hypothetical protein Z043_109899 [Scleropages formosus]|uniref:RGS domain-containing protein n=1 Tax=Scleropages formosus TaxID=113540 RepID=A0A0P7V8C9_SCLFO|nr:hypothetical protein Z043_109899 [Scleropages formosus]